MNGFSLVRIHYVIDLFCVCFSPKLRNITRDQEQEMCLQSTQGATLVFLLFLDNYP